MNSTVKIVLFSLISAFGFSFCFFTVVQFAVYLYRSGHRQILLAPYKNEGECRLRTSQDLPWLPSLLTNVCLLLVFVFQHTVMAADWWKGLVKSLGCGVLIRSLYVIATSLAMQMLFNYGQPLFPCSQLWGFQPPSGSLWSFVIFLLHAFSWLMILAICLTLDYAELMGVKQVYYSVLGLPRPLSLKSEGYKQLFRHFRHPFSSTLLIVLWVVPVMSWDRFLLAGGLTAYLLLGHSLDTDDYYYLREQYQLKEEELWQAGY